MVSRQDSSAGLDEFHAVMGADGWRGGEVEGVEHPDGVRLVSEPGDLGAGGPAQPGGLAGGGEGAAGLAAAEDQGDDAAGHVLVDAGQRGRLDLQAGFLGDLAAEAVGDLLAELEHAAGRLPVAVIAPPDEQGPAGVVDYDGGDAHRVACGVCHGRGPFRRYCGPVDHTYRRVEEYSCQQI